MVTNHFFSPKAVLLNSVRNETEPAFSAIFGRSESRKFGEVLQSTSKIPLVMMKAFKFS